MYLHQGSSLGGGQSVEGTGGYVDWCMRVGKEQLKVRNGSRDHVALLKKRYVPSTKYIQLMHAPQLSP